MGLTALHSRNSCKTLKCPKCNWHYKYQETLEIHMKEKHPETETQCAYCIGGQPHPRLARGESYTCGYKPYRCDICNYSTTTKGNLSIHLQSDKHSNNMQELQNGGSGVGVGGSSSGGAPDAKIAATPPVQQHAAAAAAVGSGGSGVVTAAAAPGSSMSGAAARKSKPRATWRCDFCSYETTEARNLRIHMTSEKHAQNLMALQQNMRQMQMNHQMAQMFGQDPSSAAAAAALLGLPSIMGLQHPPPGPPPHPPPPPVPGVFDPATMFLSPFIPSLPETAIDLTKPLLPGGVGPTERLTDEARKLSSGPRSSSCSVVGGGGLFACAICNVFTTDSIDLLQHHIQLDRSKTTDQDSVAVVAGTYHCNLCQYKTSLKANFQLHCKTDKHLQRLQLINHIQEGTGIIGGGGGGGGRVGELSQKFLGSGSPVQVYCNACDYHTNSIYRLQMHVVAGSSHESNARIYQHLQVEEDRLLLLQMAPGSLSSSSSRRWSYRCALCCFAAPTKFGLIAHAQSEAHALNEQRHMTSSSGADKKSIPYFSSVEEDDSTAESDAEDSAGGSLAGDGYIVQHRAPYENPDDGYSDDMKRCTDGDIPFALLSSSFGYNASSVRGARDSTDHGIAATSSQNEREKTSSAHHNAISCILCMEEIADREQLSQHLLEVHKVKVETLQSIMTLVNSADGIAPFHLTTGNNGPPVDNGKAGHYHHHHQQQQQQQHHPAGELKSSANCFHGVESASNLNDAASCFSTGGAGFTRLFQNNYPTNRAEESNEDGMSDDHKTTGVLSMEDEEGGDDEERDDKTQGKVYSASPDDAAAANGSDRVTEGHTQCQTCMRKLPTVDALYSHQIELGHLELKQTSTGPGYLCWHKGCHQHFKTAVAVQVHHREVHVRESSQVAAATVSQQQQQQQKQEDEFHNRCAQCNLVFRSSDQLQVHSYYHVIRSAADCVVCGKRFQSALEAKAHLEKCHTEALTQEQLARYQARADVASSLALLGASCLDGLSSGVFALPEDRRKSTRDERNHHKTVLDEAVEEDEEEEEEEEEGEQQEEKEGESRQDGCEAATSVADNVALPAPAKSDRSTYDENQDALLRLDENSNANLSDTAEDGTAKPAHRGLLEGAPNRSEGEGSYSILKYKCHRCKVGFPKMSYLSAHNKTLQHRQGSKLSHPLEKYFDPNRPYKCEVCMESFTQKNILLVHYNSVSHLHRLKQHSQQQQHQHHQQETSGGELPVESTSLPPKDVENRATTEEQHLEEDGDEDLSRRQEPKSFPVENSTSVIASVGRVPSAASCLSATSGGGPASGDSASLVTATTPAARGASSNVMVNVTTTHSSAFTANTDTADQLTTFNCARCRLDFDRRSLLDSHLCSDFHRKVRGGDRSAAEMTGTPQTKPSARQQGPPRVCVPAAESGGSRHPVVEQWSSSTMQSSTSLTSTSVSLTAPVIMNVFPEPATTVSPAATGQPAPLSNSPVVDEYALGKSVAVVPRGPLPVSSFLGGVGGGGGGGCNSSTVANGNLPMVTAAAKSFEVPPKNQNSVFCCHRCGTVFASSELLAQHLQMACCGGGGGDYGSCAQERYNFGRLESIPTGFKPRVHQTLLENFGFDCVMQFNECRQKVSSLNSKNKSGSLSEKDRESERRGAATEGETVAGWNGGCNGNDDDLPELKRCFCCLCGKEFSSVWVLKAHEEEVHKELLPSNLIQEFGKQFRKVYERRSHPHDSKPSPVGGDSTGKQHTVVEPNNRKYDFCIWDNKAAASSSKSDENNLMIPRNPGFSAEMAAMQTAQMMQLPLMMGLNLLPPPVIPMMMPLGAELFGLPPFPLMDSMLMLQQHHQQQQQQHQHQQQQHHHHQQQQQQHHHQHQQQQNQKAGALGLTSQSIGALHQKSARTRITDEQLSVLRAHFDINNSPSEEQIRTMSEKTGLVAKVIKHWFRNTLFKERQRNKDSPYNFSNPPSTTLNLEEYEKLNHSLVKKEKSIEERTNKEQSENLTVPPLPPVPRTESGTHLGQSSQQQHQTLKENDNQITTIKLASTQALTSDALQRLAFPPPLLSSGNDLSAAVLSNFMHLPPLYLPSPVLQGGPSVSKVGLPPHAPPGIGAFGGIAGSQERRANRTRFTKHQIRVLQEFFEQNAYPKDEELENLSKLLDLSPRVIVVWFQNARQKVRKNFENQPAVDMSEDGPGGGGGTSGANSSSAMMIPFPTGSTYQCKRCFASFPNYEDLVRHKQTSCFKEEENCYVSVSNSAVSGDISDDEDVDKADGGGGGDEGASRSSVGSESKGGFGGVSSAGIEYCCEKCNLIFCHLDKWKEHQSIHAASLGLAVPQGSVTSMAGRKRPPAADREKAKENNLHTMEGFPSAVIDDVFQVRHWSDDGDDKDDQPRDKRIRTTILPEQLDYLYHKYQSDCNPSRKQLDAIAARVGLKKRVVQVWFQNTRARERKGQYRAHQQLIHKRCPFCKALFRAKTALEAHLTSKHPEEMSRREINIDSIPDEPTTDPTSAAEVSSAAQGFSAKGSAGCGGGGGSGGVSTAGPAAASYGMNSSFLSGIQNIRNSLGSSTELLHPNMQRLYEDSFKKYIDELSHVSHQPSSSSSKPEASASSGGGGYCFRPDLASATATRIKQEDSPLDLSMTMPKNGSGDGSYQRLYDDGDVVPVRMAAQRPYLLPDDSHSESHSEDNNDDGGGSGAGGGGGGGLESGPPSPSSSASNQSKQALGGGGGGGGMAGKRYRTQMSSLQIKVMKSVFADYKTPTMAECEALGHEIGLPKRVVQVWFQNARAKEKKWSLLFTEGGGSNPPGTSSSSSSSNAVCPPEPTSIAVTSTQCSLCDVSYTPQHTIQDHLFTRKHIDRVKSSLRGHKETMMMMSTGVAKDGSLETKRAGKVAEPESKIIGRSGELSSSTSSRFQGSAAASTSLHSINVNQTAGLQPLCFETKSKAETQSTGTVGHKVKMEKNELLKTPMEASIGMRLPTIPVPNSTPVMSAVKPVMAPANILGQFGAFPGIPTVPNPAEMMTMMPYLFPCLTGFYPTGGMPFMPGLDNMFMYDPVNFGTPLNLLQIPPTCIKKIQEKLQDKDCTLTHYTQDCHGFADLRQWVTDEDWSVARKVTVDVGYICKKCQIVYPGRSACIVHQQTTCFLGAPQNVGENSILKLEQLQYECSACSVRCSTIVEFKAHCSLDFHQQHLVGARKSQSKFVHVVENALSKAKPLPDLDNEAVAGTAAAEEQESPSRQDFHD